MAACGLEAHREPDEDMRGSHEQVWEEDEGDDDWCAGRRFNDDRTGEEGLDPTKVRQRVRRSSMG